jgi:glycine/D-amino acid oxidase-like deaminating enzyme
MNDSAQNESVLIVGAGIIGIACAHYLSRAGFKVTVIDQGTIARACSHGNCGYICPSHVLPLTAHGMMQADHFVIAAGAWSTKLAEHFGCHIPIEPGKGYSITMQRPEVCPRYPMLLLEHHVGVTPFAEGYRLGSMWE